MVLFFDMGTTPPGEREQDGVPDAACGCGGGKGEVLHPARRCVADFRLRGARTSFATTHRGTSHMVTSRCDTKRDSRGASTDNAEGIGKSEGQNGHARRMPKRFEARVGIGRVR